MHEVCKWVPKHMRQTTLTMLLYEDIEKLPVIRLAHLAIYLREMVDSRAKICAESLAAEQEVGWAGHSVPQVACHHDT